MIILCRLMEDEEVRNNGNSILRELKSDNKIIICSHFKSGNGKWWSKTGDREVKQTHKRYIYILE